MLQFLDNPPPFLFFTGKGGVGKTSLACATAVALADQGKRVLLVSTDPASNVGQVFSVAIGNQITAVPSVNGLHALEIDPQAAAAVYRSKIVDPVRGKLPDAVVRSIEEQLSGACTTEIAAFDEFTALLTDAELLADYDHILFDTAPTGHTIRLLQLPSAWSDFLEAGKGDASCLGPLAGLEKQRDQYAAAVAALANPAQTRLILVARAQKSTLREVARTHEELAAIGMAEQHLVINGCYPQAGIADDPLAAAIWQREQAALTAIPAVLKTLPCDLLPLLFNNLMGIEALRQLLQPAAELAQVEVPLEATSHPDLHQLVETLASDGHGLVMLMGKGGVGKTTLAAAVAVELAKRGYPVHLSTTDPAAHLSETLDGALPNLEVSRIDPKVEVDRYRHQVLSTKGAQLDEAGRALLEEDLRSPCTEEIAVFQAFSRIIRDSRERFVIMDTAPTGHTLLLLDATGAYHREIARQMGGKGLHYTTPMMQLQDPKQTKVLIVTLPEPTPVLEAASLQEDLRRAGIEPWAWLINHSLQGLELTAPLLQARALQQRPHIETVRTELASRYAVIPLQAEEPVGIDHLQQLCRL